MEYCKLQMGCMMVVFYIVYIYIREKQIYCLERKNRVFDLLLITAVISVFFDGMTAYTVNHLEKIPAFLNGILHMCFLISLDVMDFMMFLYMLDITKGIPEKRRSRFLIFLPLVVDVIVVVLSMPQLRYERGIITNYSMGTPVYTCYATVAFYTITTIIVFLRSWRSFNGHKRIILSTYFLVSVGVTVFQMIYPEALITAIVSVFVVVGAYLNHENPLYTRLKKHNSEMMMGFATLIENRDNNTGGHIHRTTAYVKLLAEELEARGFHREELTKDYIENLVMAAPMHDIGKIAIPDAILQKPGKLTFEEFEMMKTHASQGGKIIRDTFGHMENDLYEKIAYEVATYHHEKWNGKGYPEGLAGRKIPLCARIMAIADVFDAVSAKRCYRDALPVDECFRIIEEGSGRDFDPEIADVFLNLREKIETDFFNYSR